MIGPNLPLKATLKINKYMRQLFLGFYVRHHKTMVFDTRKTHKVSPTIAGPSSCGCFSAMVQGGGASGAVISSLKSCKPTSSRLLKGWDSQDRVWEECVVWILVVCVVSQGCLYMQGLRLQETQQRSSAPRLRLNGGNRGWRMLGKPEFELILSGDTSLRTLGFQFIP